MSGKTIFRGVLSYTNSPKDRLAGGYETTIQEINMSDTEFERFMKDEYFMSDKEFKLLSKQISQIEKIINANIQI